MRSVECGEFLRLIDGAGTKFLQRSTIPSQQNTIVKAEAWANNWLASNVVGYQAVVHIFTLDPLLVTVWCAELGVPVPASWWNQ